MSLAVANTLGFPSLFSECSPLVWYYLPRISTSPGCGCGSLGIVYLGPYLHGYSLYLLSCLSLQQTEYDILMEEQVSFVDLPETVGGYGTEEIPGPSEAERRKMTLEEVSLSISVWLVPFPSLGVPWYHFPIPFSDTEESPNICIQRGSTGSHS